MDKQTETMLALAARLNAYSEDGQSVFHQSDLQKLLSIALDTPENPPTYNVSNVLNLPTMKDTDTLP